MIKKQFRIAAKKLGEVALPSFCARCFWYKVHYKGSWPNAIFPSIFSRIDSYTKEVVHSFFDAQGRPPKFLAPSGVIERYIEPPTHNDFQIITPDNVLLTGSPDAMFELKDKTLLIGDYKTADPKGADDPLYEMYATQLNVYALLAKALGYGTTSKLALIYTKPLTDEADAAVGVDDSEEGFAMRYQVSTFEVPLAPKSVTPLLATAREIFESATPGPGRDGCRNCSNLERAYTLMKESEDRVAAFASTFLAA
jgi:hypothetical protein